MQHLSPIRDHLFPPIATVAGLVGPRRLVTDEIPSVFVGSVPHQPPMPHHAATLAAVGRCSCDEHWLCGHIQVKRLLQFALSCGRAWLLLLPNYFAELSWFADMTREVTSTQAF